MVKNGANSWFTVVRKAFGSPIKEDDKRSSRRREDNEQEEERRRRKRRWIFKMPKEIVAQQCEARTIITTANIIETRHEVTEVSEGFDVDQSHAISITKATTATSSAAVKKAQASVEVVRLANTSICVKEYHAAVVIQTAFRGYLARIALRALRGVVKLQALVRGHNVRNRAQMTLRCMQAMLRVQTRICKERAAKLSYENCIDYRKSMATEYAGDNGIYFGDASPTVSSFQDLLSKIDEDAFKRENALAYAFSHQIWGTGDDHSCSGEELDVNPEWSSQRSRNYRETAGRASCDQREPVKIVEIDTYGPDPTNTERSKNQQQNYCHQQLMSPNSLHLASPGRRASKVQYHHSPLTPSPAKERHLHVRSASPPCVRWFNSMPQMSVSGNNNLDGRTISHGRKVDAVPNYMAATASAKARSRCKAHRGRGMQPQKGKEVDQSRRDSHLRYSIRRALLLRGRSLDQSSQRFSH